jgi:Na+-driven multidrug efflux pump
MVGVGLGRFGLEWLASETDVGQLAVSAGGIVALTEPMAAVLFVGDGIFLGMLALATMVVSTGLGSAAAILLMLFSPLGDSVEGIWWALALMLVVRGVVLLAGYRRSAVTAVKS